MKMPLDEVLIAIALSAYTLGALALLVYFFSREPWLRNFGAPLAILGCVAQFAQLIVRFETTHVWPLLNLYGSLSLFAAMSVAIYIGFAFRYDLWFAGGFVLALAAVFLAYGITWYEGTMPPVPSLQSYWAKIHVPIVVSSYAAFLVAFVFSSIYLLKYYAERSFEGRRVLAAVGGDLGPTVAAADFAVNPMMSSIAGSVGVDFSKGVLRDTPALVAAAQAGNPVARWLAALPSLAQLDVIVYRAVAIGLPLISIGIITGAMWAKEAWGAYWQWDPKETAALFSWIIYLAYMHLHTRHGWRGLRTNWVSVIGFLSIIFCYLGVNIWISGLHSYKV
jgi:cytochrome c-type biogenesis protein CcsB